MSINVSRSSKKSIELFKQYIIEKLKVSLDKVYYDLYYHISDNSYERSIEDYIIYQKKESVIGGDLNVYFTLDILTTYNLNYEKNGRCSYPKHQMEFNIYCDKTPVQLENPNYNRSDLNLIYKRIILKKDELFQDNLDEQKENLYNKIINLVIKNYYK